jgi:Mrp family chromosome partitioning ATPase
VPNLTVITSGAIPYNPWEMFRSQRVSEVSNYLLKHYDYVLYDTPSALIFTDALNLAPVVDAAFLCVRAQEPLTGAEGRLIELLNQANVSVLGSVLNNVPLSVLEGYSNYQRYYGPTPGEAPALLSTSAEVAPSAPRSVSRPTQPA